MKLNFCTLFDSNYLSRGVAMHQSLLNTGVEFHLYIFPFDQLCYVVLQAMKLDHVTLVSLNEFEDNELLNVKPSRTKTEYCWTCTSSTILYCLQKFNLENCTYVDADLFFYRSPEILFSEMPDHFHVMITSHRYTPYYDQSKKSGTFCVQFMYFDKSNEALEVLIRWRNQCLDWCYNRIEDGKFGDQKYLDDWVSRYPYVWELKNHGGGLAPWNIQQYKFVNSNEGMVLKTHEWFKPVFYHFHGVKFYQSGKTALAPNTYQLSKTVKELFYVPYLAFLQKAKSQIEQYDRSFDSHGSRPSNLFFKERYLKGMLSYVYCNFIKRFFT